MSLIYGDYYFIESLKRFNDVFNQTALTYIPATNFTGTDTFSYQAADSAGNCATATVTVTVDAANTFFAQISLLPATGRPAISFLSSTGKTYFVQYLDNLAAPNGWNLLVTNVPGSGAVMVLSDTNPPARRFYRVGMVAK